MRARLWWIILAALFAIPIVTVVARETGGWQLATTVAGLRVRGVVYVPDLEVFVVETGGEPLGLSALSPHLGERLLYCEPASMFVDENGDRFDRLGNYLGGPAPRGMDHVQARVRGDLVGIDPTEVTKGPARGPLPPLDPKGPRCGVSGELEETRPGFARPDPQR